MTVRIEVGYRRSVPDPRGKAVLQTIRSFLRLAVTGVRSVNAYTIDAELSADEVERVRLGFTDAVTQCSAVGRLEPEPADFVIAVGFRPGVTDAVGRSARVALEDMLGRELEPNAAVYTSKLYFISGIDSAGAERVATGLLANPLIEHFEVWSIDEYLASEPDLRVPAIRSTHAPSVRCIGLSGSDDDLLRISRERVLSLSLPEMKCIRSHFVEPATVARRHAIGLSSDPTDVELECLAQTWSEHCKHKIFNATITYHDGQNEPVEIHSLFKGYICGSTRAIGDRQLAQGDSWLVSVFHDNAGVIAFNDRYHLVYKVETHNSPSALDPYGGAMTGIVGVNRDPFGTGLGADLLVNVWGYCLADPRYAGPLPQGLMHPRRVRNGVHQGVIDGGNQSGIPYGRGWEIFDNRFVGKPLVYCGTVARMPVISAGRPTHEKVVKAGDHILMCGGRIGKDGIHGATFSSAELDESSPVQAVQIGDPITQKKMFDFLEEARDLGLYEAITDNGAGGLSSSVGELCQLSGGARLELANAPLKYRGLDPWEILISEAQERMTLAVSTEHLPALLELAARREVEVSTLGQFNDSGLFEVTWEGRPVASLPLSFMHDGLPTMDLVARWQVRRLPEPAFPALDDWTPVLDQLLRSPNVASGEKMARHYDHEVKGLSVVKPYVGLHSDVPADATVFLVEHGSKQGFVLSEGINPFYSDIDTWWMTASVVDEAIRKAVGAGARLDHMAGLDNYCWPDPVVSDKTPDGEYKLAQLVRSTQALSEICQAYGVPCISGKDSMKNDSSMGGVRISIPPTLLFSVISVIDDVTKAITLDAKTAGAWVYLLGATRDELGASELTRVLAQPIGNAVPRLNPEETIRLYRAMQEAILCGLVQSCHSPTRGGWAAGLAKVAMGGELGLDVDLDLDRWSAQLPTVSALFSESNGRYIATVGEEHRGAFEALMQNVNCACVGCVTEEPIIRVHHGGRLVVCAAVHDLKLSWKETLDAV